jgi:Rieske Fe-S protein
MPEAARNRSDGEEAAPRAHPRRRFLLWIPAAVYGLIAAALGTSAFKFLRPQAPAESPSDWLAVGRVSELGGAEPVRRAVSVERRAGWSVGRRDEAVFVLPRGGSRVVSAVCPHEGCEVEWDAGSRAFLCPCHDSRFDADGARTEGPAERGLYQLPSRVNGDTLEVQFRPGGGRDAGAGRG